ncbi:phosphatase PAP2 family protein [Halosimplex litoreum]|uniref:Phosphatase PAP2 family protein n=1 Tax=Halosimplex litoreum TaxID=1198301 RepID=A0A7T3KTR6_9EURY|nr:phosphatase PAP2 family protein [Halosimplex litoreum]QPV61454.1 phosphatase PAP2 family protein [Halosimplex litoreum]
MRLVSNGRGVGVTEAIHELAAWPVVLVFGLVTQLGDGWFLFVLGGALLVAGEEFPVLGVDRRRAVFVLALALTYVAVVGALKGYFGLDRPPGATEPPALVRSPALSWVPGALSALLERATTAEGPGFPSGHALGTTMVWGGLALVVDRGTARQRAAGAVAIIGLVSLSRLVLGVHYLVDVVAGVAVGLVLLGALYRLADGGTEPGRVLGVAVATGIAGLFTGVTFDSVAATGGAVGGWVVWRAVADSTPAHPTNSGEIVAGFAVLAGAGALFAALEAVEPSLPVAFVGATLAVGGAVGAPLLGERAV